MIDLDQRYTTRRLGFSGVISNLSGYTWVFFASDVRAECVFDHAQFLHIRVSASFLPTEIFWSFFHARCDYVQRRDIWASLILVKPVLGPWLVGGDFNVVRDASECLGSRGGRLLPMEEFNTFILDSGLIDAGSWFLLTGEIISARFGLNISLVLSRITVRFCFSGMPRLFAKMKRLKHHLWWWNRDVFGNIFDRLTEAERTVRSAEAVCEADPSDANWTSLSDRNEDLDLIQQSGALFFQDLLTDKPSALDCPDFSGFPSVISAVENDGIAAIPSLEEDVFGAVLDFFRGALMPQGFTATTITLIPKVEGARAWSDFRPISLCNVTNKIIPKLLYSWMRDLVERLVSPNQSGFVPGRMISDNILFAQDLTHSITLPTRGERVVALVSAGISHCHFSVNINGSLSGFFGSSEASRVNAAKSSLILPPRCSGRLRSRLLRITGFAEGHPPLKYLGVPLYRGNRTCSLFEPLLQSVRRKFRQGSSLWSRFLFQKYFRLDAPACVPARGSISPIWRRLLRIRPRAEPGIRWRVGLGDVSFWDDTWLEDAPLSSQCVVRGSRDVRISQFLSEGSWDFDRLCAVVAPSVAEEIILIPVLSGEPDLARWIHSSDVVFLLKTKFWILEFDKLINQLIRASTFNNWT
ncbi:uncharacterized protein LOC142504981 [Primulina tabacum]|uniref:uncharacterized protein LOC142504981 n=1 Tax=Primulina tabacum TaxID=48773 RepID=UPI003F59E5C3